MRTPSQPLELAPDAFALVLPPAALEQVAERVAGRERATAGSGVGRLDSIEGVLHRKGVIQ
jgi:hypothetical protein